MPKNGFEKLATAAVNGRFKMGVGCGEGAWPRLNGVQAKLDVDSNEQHLSHTKVTFGQSHRVFSFNRNQTVINI